MGWRGTMRSVAAGARRMEREAERRHKIAVREQVASEAADAVAAWEAYLHELVTVHTGQAGGIDWGRMLLEEAPTKPEKIVRRQNVAKSALANFTPRPVDLLRGGSVRLRTKLETAVRQAEKEDDAESAMLAQQYAKAYDEWRSDFELADRIFAGDVVSIRQVIAEYQSLTEVELIGSAIKFSIGEGFVHAKPHVHNDEIVPRFRRKQLAGGGLSETKMPVTQFNELYQDYVASVALKVAGDLFSILPFEQLYVTCTTTMLNASTGHQEATPILSVEFVRETFQSLRLSSIDPSESLTNFNHAMSFRKTKGFAAIAPLIEDN